MMGFLAATTVHWFRGKISLATTAVVTLSFAPSSFTALKPFESGLGSVHRLGEKFTFPLSLGIGDSSLLGCVLLVGVLKPTGCTPGALSLLVCETDL
jgi:hypothetical protein